MKNQFCLFTLLALLISANTFAADQFVVCTAKDQDTLLIEGTPGNDKIAVALFEGTNEKIGIFHLNSNKDSSYVYTGFVCQPSTGGSSTCPAFSLIVPQQLVNSEIERVTSSAFTGTLRVKYTCLDNSEVK